MVYSRPVEWQPAHFRVHRGASAVLLCFLTPHRPGEPPRHPAPTWERSAKPSPNLCKGSVLPCAQQRGGRQGREVPGGVENTFLMEPTFSSLKRGNRAWGADPGLWEHMTGRGESAKCPSQIPTALEIPASTPPGLCRLPVPARDSCTSGKCLVKDEICATLLENRLGIHVLFPPTLLQFQRCKFPLTFPSTFLPHPRGV